MNALDTTTTRALPNDDADDEGAMDPATLIDIESIVDQVLREQTRRHAPADAYAPRRRDSLVAHARRFARRAWRAADHEKHQ